MKLLYLRALLPVIALGWSGPVSAKDWRDSFGMERPVEWVSTPAPAEFAAARSRGVKDTVVQAYACTVGELGDLLDCYPDWRTRNPQAVEAAVRPLLLSYRAPVILPDGLRTVGRPIHVELSVAPKPKRGSDADRSGANGVVWASASWLARPSASEIAAVFPKEAAGRGSVGVTFSCEVNSDGGLTNCVFQNADAPVDQEAVRPLLDSYRMPVETEDGLRTPGLPVRVVTDLTPDGAPRPMAPVPPPGGVYRHLSVDIGPLSGVAEAPKAGGTKRRALSDRRTTVLRYVNAAEDCAPVSVDIHVSQPPLHGRVEVLETTAWAYWHWKDPRRNCEARQAGKRLVYTPDPGFKGADQVVLEIRTAGEVITRRLDITVDPYPAIGS